MPTAPALHPSLNVPVVTAVSELVAFRQDVLEGTKPIPIPSRYCDVRDVARAHILAAEVPGANGRYLVSHVNTVPSKFISDTLQVLSPTRAEQRKPHWRHPALDPPQLRRDPSRQAHAPDGLTASAQAWPSTCSKNCFSNTGAAHRREDMD